MAEERLEEQIGKQKAAIEQILRNGNDVTLKQIAWLIYSQNNSLEQIVESQRRYRDECPAFLAWQHSGWWRGPLQNAAGNIIAYLLLGGLMLFVALVVTGAITLPTIP